MDISCQIFLLPAELYTLVFILLSTQRSVETKMPHQIVKSGEWWKECKKINLCSIRMQHFVWTKFLGNHKPTNCMIFTNVAAANCLNIGICYAQKIRWLSLLDGPLKTYYCSLVFNQYKRIFHFSFHRWVQVKTLCLWFVIVSSYKLLESQITYLLVISKKNENKLKALQFYLKNLIQFQIILYFPKSLTYCDLELVIILAPHAFMYDIILFCHQDEIPLHLIPTPDWLKFSNKYF